MLTIDRQAYATLLTTYQPQIIESEQTYAEALSALEQFMNKGENLSPEELAIVNLLSVLIGIYEDQQITQMNLEPVSPQEILIHLMELQELKQVDLVPILGSKGIVSEVINGKREISKNQAKKLAEFFSVSPALFI
jgi:HTH-type transcriptional regulator/antitoxin HigA